MIIEQIFSLWVTTDLEPSHYRHSLFLSNEDDLQKVTKKNGQSWSHLSSAFIGWYFLQLDHWIFSKWKIYLFYTLFRVKRLETNVKDYGSFQRKCANPKNRRLDLLNQEGPQLTQLKALEEPKKLWFLKTNLAPKNDGCQQESPFLRGLYFRCKIFVSGRNLCS